MNASLLHLQNKLLCVLKKGANLSQREWTHPFLLLYALVLNVVKRDLSLKNCDDTSGLTVLSLITFDIENKTHINSTVVLSFLHIQDLYKINGIQKTMGQTFIDICSLTQSMFPPPIVVKNVP